MVGLDAMNMSLFLKKILSICLGLMIICGQTASADQLGEIQSNRSGVFFYSDNIPSDVCECFADNIGDIAQSMTVSLSKLSATIEFGNIISVVGTDKLFLTPIYCDNQLEYLLYINISEYGFSVGYSASECKELEELDDGIYCFYSDETGLYVLGDNEKITIVQNKLQESMVSMDSFDVSELAIVDFKGKVHNENVDENSTKSVLSKELSTVKRVANGTPGYCWLSSAVAVCQYYGSNVTMSTAHTYAHGLGHVYTQCTGGGTLSDIYNVIHSATGKTGVKVYYSSTTRINAANELQSINNNIPVATLWMHYDSSGTAISGHSMVFTGYQFNNTTGAFTYIIMDPNQTSRYYMVSTYSASTPGYVINGDTYYWRHAIYDWN